jgi:hypothetical protein
VKPNHHLTDSLLGIIEDSAAYKVALGFDKGNVGAVSSGGKKVIEQYQSIARKLFIEVENSAWSDTKDDIKLLGESVKNCVMWYASHQIMLFYYSFISRIKKNYVKHRASILETGQGLLNAGRENEILPGSEIASIWGRSFGPYHAHLLLIIYLCAEKVQAKFPWYQCMDLLMGTSPVVSKAAITNSRTPIDLSLLDRGASGQVCLLNMFIPNVR